MRTLAKPRGLKSGDHVAIAAPGASLSSEERDRLDRAASVLERWGFRVKTMSHPYRSRGYLTGDDKDRAQALMGLFEAPEVRAILCARGGYGAQRIIPFLDPAVIQENPKVFVGSSDMTVLLVYLMECCSLVSFHGPNVATSQFWEGEKERTQASLRTALGLGLPGESPACRCLKRGLTQGRLKGGCLSLLVTTIGTPYEIDLRQSILFLEDVNEPLYRIDRMLTHLWHAGKLDEIQGLVVGEMITENQHGTDLDSVILDVFHDQDFPIIAGFPSGHGRTNLTIPLGVGATLDGDQGRLIFHESGLMFP
jgi:muramoyltetrapeptide carboxypeptidase